MKALTDKIIESLKSKRDGFIGSLKNKKTVANSQGFREGLDWAIETIDSLEAQAEFEEVARVVMKHFGSRPDIYHPHMSANIDVSKAELLESKQGTGYVEDYIPD
ncbi:MAG TPA: hypothetical protein VMV77_15165 [Bacteroidales bacterium]|nr:hypothetical protein [Bacteroidales bacterium]